MKNRHGLIDFFNLITFQRLNRYRLTTNVDKLHFKSLLITMNHGYCANIATNQICSWKIDE